MMQSIHKKIKLLAGVFFVINIAAMGLWLLLGSPLPPDIDWRDPAGKAAKKSFVTKLEKLQADWDMPTEQRQRMLWPVVRRMAQEGGLEPATVMAVLAVESRFRPHAISPDGALGLMQIMPGTASGLGFKTAAEAMDPIANLRAGIDYLAKLKRKYSGDLNLALAAYNAGPGMISRHGGMPPFEETQKYVQLVLSERERFRASHQALASR